MKSENAILLLACFIPLPPNPTQLPLCLASHCSGHPELSRPSWAGGPHEVSASAAKRQHLPAVTGSGALTAHAPPAACEEAAAAKAIKLLEKIMSYDNTKKENKPSFMAQLDAWVDESVVGVLVDGVIAWYEQEGEESYSQAVDTVKKAIRSKVLESYHNGQAVAGVSGTRTDRRDARPSAGSRPENRVRPRPGRPGGIASSPR